MAVLHKSVLRILLLLLFAVVCTAMVVPQSALEFLISASPWTSQAVTFLAMAMGWDTVPIISFAALGFVAHFGWRRWPARRFAICALLVASLAEVVQLWVPGRQAAMSHAILNVLGAAFGFTTAWLVSYAWSNQSFPADFQHSTRWMATNSHN